MKIIVCVKHVVDTTEVRVDKKTGELVLRGIPTKINDYDKNAIEEAVKIKQATNGTVTLLTVGPKEALKTVKEGLAMGADKAYIIDDSNLPADDPVQIARVLSLGIKRIGDFDIIFCGSVSEDRSNSLTGPGLAEWLGIDHVSYVQKVDVGSQSVEVERRCGNLIERIEASFPVVLTVDRTINTPRLPTAIQIMKVPANRIEKWSLDDVEASFEAEGSVGMKGYHVVSTDRKNVLLEGDAATTVKQLTDCLMKEGVL